MGKYVKDQRVKWTLEAMQTAERDVIMLNKSQKRASKDNGVPRETLRRHLQNVHAGEGVEKSLGRKPVLSEEQEEELTDIILDMEAKLFGLTQSDVKHYVYLFCEHNNISNNFNKERKMAGKDWFAGFCKRHPELSMCVPEATSIHRSIGFNKVKVGKFMDLLEGVLFKDSARVIPEANIYNVDESGFTICHTPSKIVAKKGKKGCWSPNQCRKREKCYSRSLCVCSWGICTPNVYLSKS